MRAVGRRGQVLLQAATEAQQWQLALSLLEAQLAGRHWG